MRCRVENNLNRRFAIYVDDFVIAAHAESDLWNTLDTFAPRPLHQRDKDKSYFPNLATMHLQRPLQTVTGIG